jgi:hypothetical protein
MRLIYRRLLLLLSICIFFLVAPLVVLYAIGYRYSPTAPKPVSVGVVLLSTLPSKAQVWADNVYAGKTPRALSNLMPGSVDVRIQKDGYRDWEKHVPVEPARATTLNTIRLFPTHIAAVQLASNVSLMQLAPNKKLLAVTDTKNQVSVLDGDGVSVVAPVKLKGQPSELIWSPDSSSLLLHTGEAWDVLPVASLGQITPLPQLKSAGTVMWDPRSPGRFLAISASQALVAAHSNSPIVTPLLRGVEDVAVGSRGAYVLLTDGSVEQIDFQGNVVERLPILEGKKVSQLRVSAKDELAVLTEDQGVWMRGQDGNWKAISQQTRDAIWSSSGLVLLLQTAANELSVYTSSDNFQYLPPDHVQLITRLSSPISHLQWLSSDTHVLYQLGDQIAVSEVDARDYSVQTILDSTNTGNAMTAVGADSEALYYIKKQGASTWAVKADLVVKE